MRSIDSIELVEHSFKINIGIFNGYKIEKKIALNHGIQSSGGGFTWINKKNEWIIDDAEVDYMLNAVINQRNEFWKLTKITKSKKTIKLVEFPLFFDNLAEDSERQKRMKSDNFVYFFSKPVFNKKKDIFIIQYEILLLPYTKTTLIYKKENGNWVKIGSLSQDW